jgi:PEP-CTERM motif
MLVALLNQKLVLYVSFLKKRIDMQKIFYALTGIVLGSGLLTDLNAQAATLLPDFDAATFNSDSSISDNRYFPLVPGTRFVYEGENVDEDTGESVLERNETFITFESKNILGVTTRVVRDTAYVDDILVEDTRDWYAQDTDGNVWYMGEFVTNFVYDDEGNLIGTNNDGSWEAGVNGALPGYIMETNPQVGDNYYQESAPNDGALDQAKVFSIGESISIDFGDFDNVLKTLESTELTPGVLEFKNYAPGIGLILVEEELDENLEPGFTSELVSVERVGAESVPEPTTVLGLLGIGLFGFGRRRSK